MNHKDLEVWKEAMGLAVEIYTVTKKFPKEELYGLTSQIQRAAVSVPSNIAEGCARKSNKETLRFLSIALGSLAEVETQLILSMHLSYVKDIDSLTNKIAKVRQLNLGLIKHIEKLINQDV